MTLRELQKNVNDACENAARYDEKTPEEIKVALQISDLDGNDTVSYENIELHYDNNGFASGCVLTGDKEPEGTLGGVALKSVSRLRWHMLTGLSDKFGLTEVMAATCLDGIGVFVRWVRVNGDWSAKAMDTESGEWEPVDYEDEANEIPANPPDVWDDVSQ